MSLYKTNNINTRNSDIIIMLNSIINYIKLVIQFYNQIEYYNILITHGIRLKNNNQQYYFYFSVMLTVKETLKLHKLLLKTACDENVNCVYIML